MGGNGQYDGVRAASASTIEIDFYYAGKRCRERIKLEPTPANLKRAANHRAAIIHAIDTGTFDYATTFPKSKNAAKFCGHTAAAMTVEAFLRDWLRRKQIQLKASTWRDYANTVEHHLIPAFGLTLLGDLSRAEVRRWCGTLTVSNKRIANLLTVLRAALTEAAEDEIIDSNPIANWRYENKEAPKAQDDVDPFTPDEQARILGACHDDQMRYLIQFLFWSGLRTSEVAALTWGDVDWARGELVIRKALTRYADEPEDTKTVAGRRTVKILRPALAALTAMKAHTFLQGQNVFVNSRTGEPYNDHQIWNRWQPIMQRAGVRYRRPYQTRHTYASMMLSAGESPMWVANQMGHSDWGMIRKVYGRWIPDADPEAGGRAEEKFGANGQHLVSIGKKAV